MKKSNGLDLVFNICNRIALTIFMIMCIYPFYYVFIYSISIPDQAVKGVFLLPRGLSLATYQSLFKLNSIVDAFLLSAARTVLGTILTVIGCSLFAYVLTKRELFGRKIFLRITVITLYLNAGLIPWYLTMKALNLNDNFLLYILPTAVSGFNVILIKTFIEQLPASLEESAMIDGAGYLTIFRKIIFPLSKPIIATIAVFSAVGQWNTWQDNYFLVTNPKLQTLQLMLYNYLNQTQNLTSLTLTNANGRAAVMITPESVKMAITIIVTIPIILVYPFMQRYFVKGIMLGAIKG